MPKPTQIFLGNGRESLAAVGELYQDLGRAIQLVGNVQQWRESDPENDEDIDLELLVISMAERLLGKRVIVKEPT